MINLLILALVSTISTAQPMTGLVLWPDNAADLDATYNQSISLEFSYCLPCCVVTGKQGNDIQYDWTSFDALLDDIASRNHQAIVRFRYEYPSSKDVDGQKGTTAVPAYIKALPDYNETYSRNPGGDGPTYYADWSNTELQWFTLQFYTDFAARYGSDPRIAFLEVGFGHWSEYHIYGTTLQFGVNFPTKAYQTSFFHHMDTIMPIPWLVSIDAGDRSYSPVPDDPQLMACRFGLFDDSFMHAEHDHTQGEGWNEDCWNYIGGSTRWQTGVCGGEISYYTDADQHNFLNPNGMYGVTWEQASAKYHLSFMIANDAPEGRYGTPSRFLSASLACGYRFHITALERVGDSTRISITNEGIAPIYRDAFVRLGDAQDTISLVTLLPGMSRTITLLGNPAIDNLTIESPYILPTQHISYEANIPDMAESLPMVSTDSRSTIRKTLRNGIIRVGNYLLSGLRW